MTVTHDGALTRLTAHHDAAAKVVHDAVGPHAMRRGDNFVISMTKAGPVLAALEAAGLKVARQR